jgi:hypothetical protein
MPLTVPAIVFLMAAAARGSHGATLGEAAFFETLRRAITPAATKSLTNADLPAAALRSEPELNAPLPEPPSKPGELIAKVDEPAPKTDPAQSEAEWRARMTNARVALDRDEVLAEGMQSRINALTSDSIGRDDPAQRADLLRQRARAVAELDRLMLDIEKDKLAIAAIEEDARKKGIPPGWLR